MQHYENISTEVIQRNIPKAEIAISLLMSTNGNNFFWGDFNNLY